MKKVLFTTFVVVVLGMAINGCGGGGSDNSGVSSQNTPVERLDPTRLHPKFD